MSTKKKGPSMKRVVRMKSSRRHYTASACVLWCFDDRFSGLFHKLVNRKRWRNVDPIRIAGGAKGLAHQAMRHEREFVLDQVGKSIRLHRAPLVALMVHSECGAYGKHFPSIREESRFYSSELHKAERVLRAYLRKHYPKVKIQKYFADFEGLHELR